MGLRLAHEIAANRGSDEAGASGDDNLHDLAFPYHFAFADLGLAGSGRPDNRPRSKCQDLPPIYPLFAARGAIFGSSNYCRKVSNPIGRARICWAPVASCPRVVLKPAQAMT